MYRYGDSTKRKKESLYVLIWFLPAGKKILCMSVHHLSVESVAEENLANHSSSLQCHYCHSCRVQQTHAWTRVFCSFSSWTHVTWSFLGHIVSVDYAERAHTVTVFSFVLTSFTEAREGGQISYHIKYDWRLQ